MDLRAAPARGVQLAVLDLEMTGLDLDKDRVIEIAVVRGDGERILREWSTLVRVDEASSRSARKAHGITREMLEGQPAFPEIAAEVRRVLGGAVMVCHNVPWDLGFLQREMDRARSAFQPDATMDTLLMARRLFAFPKNSLYAVCERLEVPVGEQHRALADARATFAAYHRMMEILDPDGAVTIGEVEDLLAALAPDSPLRLRQAKLLDRAFRERRTVVIQYQAPESPAVGPIRREIGIWRLKLPYIQGWCFLREGERVFRLDRIRSVEPGDRTYEIPAHFEHKI